MDTPIGIFDTLAASKRLREKGFSEPQAEALAEEIKFVRKVDLDMLATKQDVDALATATKQDINALAVATKQDINALAAATKEDINTLTAATKMDIQLLRSDVRELELRMDNRFKDMQLKLGSMIVGLGGVLIAVKYFG